MRITSLEIKQHEFVKSFRGYDVHEVDNFLSNIAQEWDKMMGESKLLKMQLEIAEKEASKLREVEMTLIKTLRTAEDTSTKITEAAQLEREKIIQEAQAQSQRILDEAKIKAIEIEQETTEASSRLKLDNQVLLDQQNKKAQWTMNQLKAEFDDLKTVELEELNELKIQLTHILSKIDGLNLETKSILDKYKHLQSREIPKFDIAFPSFEPVGIKETKKLYTADDSDTGLPEELRYSSRELLNIESRVVENIDPRSEEIGEDLLQGVSFSSAANSMEEQEEIFASEIEKDDLTIIEGVGSKIKEILFQNKIYSFKDLAITPAYRIKEFLESAGSQYVIHDPRTWSDQASLAALGRWTELEALKKKLVAGRKLDIDETRNSETSEIEPSTDEMLDKVNKVKAAIRKSMNKGGIDSEKELRPIDTTASKFVSEKKQSGSFFDTLN